MRIPNKRNPQRGDIGFVSAIILAAMAYGIFVGGSFLYAYYRIGNVENMAFKLTHYDFENMSTPDDLEFIYDKMEEAIVNNGVIVAKNKLGNYIMDLQSLSDKRIAIKLNGTVPVNLLLTTVDWKFHIYEATPDTPEYN